MEIKEGQLNEKSKGYSFQAAVTEEWATITVLAETQGRQRSGKVAWEKKGMTSVWPEWSCGHGKLWAGYLTHSILSLSDLFFSEFFFLSVYVKFQDRRCDR